ncbi:peptidase M24, structural domain-containing protein [Catenaria anguillulae PL171]|uniref:Peptidase M24, structural domain-containing protein n=1 Tax=Catenaria anguillulae PL171 TaxID=765915 RepID=A0A1Y2I2R6_9FUNG|nr:peptidase M24, structural domain-containing protein [Catenaria anguillulae PL171]
MPTDTSARLAALRALMKEHNLDAYIVPSEDAHQSEYIADCDGRRAFISGFTGSAGLAVVTATQAALWTDGRYFLQAGQQLDANWTLQKFGLPDTPTKEAWIVSQFAEAKIEGGRVGLDPLVIAVKPGDTLRSALSAKGHHMVPVATNLVDKVWGADRPAKPCNPLTILDTKYSGQCFTEKLDMVRAELAKPIKDGDKDVNAHALVLTALDDIAWLFNLRGSDIAFNPVFFAYALVSATEAVLWIDQAKITPAILAHLAKGAVAVRPYESVVADLTETHLAKLTADADAVAAGRKFIVDARCNLALVEALGGKTSVHVITRNPVQPAKAIKNKVEIDGFKHCHLYDAAALVSYFAWLEDELVNKGRTDIDEVDGATQLEKFRRQQPDLVGLSFPTISGSGPNGAVIHYSPEKPSARLIDPNAVYLCDSGAQFLTGTTDVTRTVHLGGKPTQFEKLANTRVLQGHIGLARAVFPKGTSGFVVDAFARAPLWSSGLDYRHGTGHGVGHYLNVHEGPHSISPRPGSLDVALQPGMIVTNEPGYYHDATEDQPAFGIRIENILVVVEKQLDNNFGGVGYLGFENVTMAPIDKALIDVSLLSPAEIEYLDSYHQECWDKVSPLLEEGSLAWNYLKRACAPLKA